MVGWLSWLKAPLSKSGKGASPSRVRISLPPPIFNFTTNNYQVPSMKYQSIKLPEDNLPHKSIIEWWYLNGHLKDERGQSYAFMNCLFKADIRKVNIPFLNKLSFKKNFPSWPYIYFSQAIISNLRSQKIYRDIQPLVLISADSFSRPLLFVNYHNLKSPHIADTLTETRPGQFHLKNKNLDLKLSSQKPPLLEGGKGWIALGRHQSYYYSLTDLSAQGSLTIDSKKVKVKGRVWFDHQWANVPYHKNKWSWFSLQLDNGTDLLCVEYNTGKNKGCLVDLIDKKNRSRHYKKLILTPGQDTWLSPKTKAQYPLSWQIEVPAGKIKLKISASLPNQEIIFGSINYWEGPIKVRGTINNQVVKGVGFMELVGYPSDYNYLFLVGQEINKKIRQRFAAKLNKLKQTL